ncbi:hypothetical protein D9M69_682770 [compost metagenome]
MIGPDGVPVAEAFRVVPHTVAVNDMSACRDGNIDTTAIHMRRHSKHHVFRRIAKSVTWPCLTDTLGIATDTARRYDHTIGG